MTTAQLLDDESELCRALLPRMVALCRRYCREQPVDIAQDAMIIVLEALRTGRIIDRQRISAFALSTCRALIIDGRRTTRRRDGLLSRNPAELASVPDESGVDRERVIRCMSKLAARERQVIKLTFWDQLSAREVAHAVDVTEGNARVLRHRAMAQLVACVRGSEAP
jgi:RNA polymerase sigma-70 factor, ECF subfamily